MAADCDGNVQSLVPRRLAVSAGTLTTTGIGNVGNNDITLGDGNTGANNFVLQTTNAGGGASHFWGTGTITVANSGTGSVLIDLGPLNSNFQNNFVLNRATAVQGDSIVAGNGTCSPTGRA
jgi:hypothetical protein